MYLLIILMKLDVSFQVYLTKENNPGSLPEGALLAIGGRYDYLLHQMWSRDYVGYACIIYQLVVVILIYFLFIFSHS